MSEKLSERFDYAAWNTNTIRIDGDYCLYTMRLKRGDFDLILAAILAYEAREAAPQPPAQPQLQGGDGAATPFVFRRYINGVERAEGVTVTQASTLEEAMLTAVRLCARRPSECAVLVLDSPSITEAVAAETERDAARWRALTTSFGPEVDISSPGDNPRAIVLKIDVSGCEVWLDDEIDFKATLERALDDEIKRIDAAAIRARKG